MAQATRIDRAEALGLPTVDHRLTFRGYVWEDGVTHRVRITINGTAVALENTTPAKKGSTIIGFPVGDVTYITLLNAMNGQAEATAHYIVQTVSEGVVVGSCDLTGMVAVHPSLGYPTVSFTYADGCADTLYLTGDSSLLIEGMSDLVITCAAEGKLGATIASYQVETGGEIFVSTSPEINVGAPSQSPAQTITVTVTDSRGYATTVSAEVPVMAYRRPSVDAWKIRRINGVEATCEAYFRGTVYPLTVGGTCLNEIRMVSYRLKKSTDDSFGSTVQVGVTPTATGYTYDSKSFLSGLDPDHSYVVQLAVTDRLASSVMEMTIPRGRPLVAYRAGKVGVNNNNPQYALDVDGAINASEGILVNGQPLDMPVSPTAKVTQTTEGATVTVTDKNGTTTAVIKNGADGQPGQPGKDGKDGKDGQDGQNGQDGQDGTTQLVPMFANSIEELEASGDTAKLYVLPDNYVYAYRYTEKSTGGYEDHEKQNTADGWTESARITSSGATEVAAGNAGKSVTSFIPVNGITADTVIRIKGTTLSSSHNFCIYDTSKAKLYGTGNSYLINNGNATTDADGVTKITMATLSVDQPSPCQNAQYIRFTVLDADDVIITVNEAIVEPEITKVWAWTNTGRAFVSADYEDRIFALENFSQDHAELLAAHADTMAAQSEAIAENAEATTENAEAVAANKADADAKIAALDQRVARLEDDSSAGGSSTDTVLATDVPAYWEPHLADKIRMIRAQQDTAGYDGFSFAVLTDVHFSENLGKRSPALIKRVMEACGIKYCLCLGDTQTRNGANYGEDYIEWEWTQIDRMFAPIRDRLLITAGNHDGSFGILDQNNDGTADDINSPANDGKPDQKVNSYDKNVNNYTPVRLYNRLFRGVANLEGVVFSADKRGYYIDDPVSKVRYILLNSHVNKWETRDNGAIKHNNMYTFRFGQAQYDLVIEALQSVPDNDWGVVVGSHVPLDRSGELTAWGAADGGDDAECWIMGDVLNAYVRRSSYEGDFTGTQDGFDAVSVKGSFSGAKGTLVGYFGGHVHLDNILGTTYTWGGMPSRDFLTFCVRCDGWQDNDENELALRTEGTTTEQSFEVFTVDRAHGIIHATKVGMGLNRAVSYAATTPTYHPISINPGEAYFSNGTMAVANGQPYTTTLTAKEGYTISSVKVIMQQTQPWIEDIDITATAYSDGVVSIAAVTGLVQISVATTAQAGSDGGNSGGSTVVDPDNLADQAAISWWDGSRMSEPGGRKNDAPGFAVTNFIPFTDGDTIVVTGTTLATQFRWALYATNDSDASPLYVGSGTDLAPYVTATSDGCTFPVDFYTTFVGDIAGDKYIRLPVVEASNIIIKTTRS